MKELFSKFKASNQNGRS